MREIIGRKPSPRVLVWEFTDDVEWALSKIAPTVLRREPGAVRQDEWDLFVTDSALPSNLSENVHALVIADGFLGWPQAPTSIARAWIVREMRSLATEFVVGPDLPRPVEAAVRRSLVPHVQRLAEQHELQVIHEAWQSGGGMHYGGNPEPVEHFLSTTEGLAVAGRFVRKGGNAECWSLPAGSDPVEWTRGMLEVLGATDPARFPLAADWTGGERWWTHAEREATSHLGQVLRERDEAVLKLAERIAEAEEEVAQAKRQAAIGDRRLLTAQGDDLLDTVVHALEDLSFQVKRMDADATEGDRLEDLRVHDKDAPRWNAIVEVRGYKKGAQLADLNRLHARFRLRFTKETGAEPRAMWYIVNHSIGEDPSSRLPALGSHPEEVNLFAEDGGLVMESPMLFDLWMSVGAGRLTRQAARRQLRNSTGRFSAGGAPTLLGGS